MAMTSEEYIMPLTLLLTPFFAKIRGRSALKAAEALAIRFSMSASDVRLVWSMMAPRYLKSSENPM
jgi:hypothetical protein